MIALFSMAFAGVVTNAPAPPPRPSRRVALVVGIDEYSDTRLGTLRYAAKDAADVAAALRDPGVGAFDEVMVLDGRVDARAFWAGFDGLAARLRRDDTFVLFVAAHGTLALESATALYLLPSDAALDRVSSTGIGVDAIERRVSALPSRRRAIILDTCYSGTGRSVLSPTSVERLSQLRGPLPAPTALAVSESEVRLYSAHLNQPALEDSALKNGVYTHFFVEALRGKGDLDGDGLVEAGEAHAWARDATMAYTGGTQVPWMESQVVGRAEVLLAGDPATRNQAERALLVGLAKLPYAAQVSVDGGTRGVAGLDPGWHRLQVSLDDEVLLDAQVHLQAGEELDVQRMVRARDARVWIEAGGQWTLPNAWTAAAGPQVDLWWTPSDRGGGRPAFGLQGAMGFGQTTDVQLFARAGWWWGGDVVTGPVFDLGAFGRLRDGERQGAPMAAPGWTLRASRGPVVVGLSASALLVYADGEPWVFPRVGATVGLSP